MKSLGGRLASISAGASGADTRGIGRTQPEGNEQPGRAGIAGRLHHQGSENGEPGPADFKNVILCTSRQPRPSESWCALMQCAPWTRLKCTQTDRLSKSPNRARRKWPLLRLEHEARATRTEAWLGADSRNGGGLSFSASSQNPTHNVHPTLTYTFGIMKCAQR